MKKTLIALAAVAVSSAAFAQVTLTGKYAVAYTSAETAAGVKSSGFGTTDGDVVFSAVEDLGSGMKAGASLALKLRGRDSVVTTTATDDVTKKAVANVTLATSGAASNTVGGRDASVFLEGGFGRITLGTIEAGNGIIGRASAGAPVIGQDNGVTLDGAGNVDMMSYSLPLMTGLTATVMLIDSIGNPGAGGMQSGETILNTTQDATLVGFAYSAGPISAGLDHTAFGKNDAPTGTDSRTRLSASYDLGVAKLGFGYQAKETLAKVKDTQMMFGVSAPLGAVTLGATYASKDFKASNTSDATGFEIGANYAFSKRTNLQAAYLSQELKDKDAATTMRVRLMHSF
jgi:predicted porin